MVAKAICHLKIIKNELTYFMDDPLDKFQETVVEIMLRDDNVDLKSLNMKKNSKGYYVVGYFDNNGIAKGDINTEMSGNVKELRIVVGKNHKNWVILSEMYFRTL